MKLLALNAFFLIFSLVWLIGHSTHRLFDWEFWFALAFVALTSINTIHFFKQRPVNA